MDGIEGLRSLPKHSVDMLFTDPPYGTTRNFWDVPLPLPELWEAVKWAVKPDGAVLFFAQCPMIRCWGHVGIVQTEAPGLYKYYSTQRPVDIGTFPKPPHNAPDEIVNYDRRIPVEGGAFLAWGHLTYTRPLTEKEASDYELRPAPVISELSRKNDDRPLSIAQQMKEAGALAEASQGDPIHKKKAPDRGDR